MSEQKKETEEEQANRIFSTRIGKTLPSYSTGSMTLVQKAIGEYKTFIQEHPEDNDAKFILEDLYRILDDM
jgi:hypothetical protein